MLELRPRSSLNPYTKNFQETKGNPTSKASSVWPEEKVDG